MKSQQNSNRIDPKDKVRCHVWISLLTLIRDFLFEAIFQKENISPILMQISKSIQSSVDCLWDPHNIFASFPSIWLSCRQIMIVFE